MDKGVSTAKIGLQITHAKDDMASEALCWVLGVVIVFLAVKEHSPVTRGDRYGTRLQFIDHAVSS